MLEGPDTDTISLLQTGNLGFNLNLLFKINTPPRYQAFIGPPA
jgi:hypothetical protein